MNNQNTKRKTTTAKQNLIEPQNANAIVNKDEYIRQSLNRFNNEYADVMNELAK